MSDQDKLQLCEDVLFRQAGEEGVVVDQRTSEVLVVNGMAHRIFELIRATGSREAVISSIKEEYDATEEEITEDLDRFLAQLRQREMLL